MSEKIGVFVCTCGPNIGDAVDVEHILSQLDKEEDVSAFSGNLFCSEEGTAFLRKGIQDNKLTRVVIAACSPKMYEKKFMNICEEAGVNPWLFQMANIREQCAWVTPDRDKATEKALSMIRGAVRRVRLQEPLERQYIDINPDVLVIGGGVAGLTAAMVLAGKGRKIHLIEKKPAIGGDAVLFEEVFPTFECAPCMLSPLLQDSLLNDNISVMTNSEPVKAVGTPGNFTVTVHKRARYIDEQACIGCGACLEVCPVRVPNEYDASLSERGAVYVPFAGALPNAPAIDIDNCLRSKGEQCSACSEACVFGAVNYDDEDQTEDIKAGGVVLAIGSSGAAEGLEKLGLGKFDNVVTAWQLERMNAANGPSGGEILLKNGKSPTSAVFIHCAGRDEAGYCSSTCCMASLTLAECLREKREGIKLTSLHRGLCLPGLSYQKFHEKAAGNGMEFLAHDCIENVREENGILHIDYSMDGKTESLQADLLVLAGPVAPAPDTEALAQIFDIELDKTGFFKADHVLMNPCTSSAEGVYLAGTCRKPGDIAEAVASGNGAAGKILSLLVPGEKLELETRRAVIDKDTCSSCGICISVCPYSAVSRDTEQAVSVVEETLCRGCGTCAAACPSGASRLRNFTNSQLREEVKGILDE